MNLRKQSLALPFSLVSGKNLGISQSSLQPLASFLPARSYGSSALTCAVNMATGNLFLQDRVLSFPNFGSPITLSAIYNSHDLDTFPWRLAAGRRIKKIEKNKSIIMVEEDGHEISYIYDAHDDAYYATEGHDGFSSLKCDQASQVTRCDPVSRTREIFNLAGSMTTKIDLAGNETHYEYNDKNQLIAIIAANGTRYEIKRENEKVEIYVIQAEPVLIHTYYFNKNGCLEKSVTPDGYEVLYSYHEKTKNIRKVTQTDGATLRMNYAAEADHVSKLNTIQVGDNTAHKHTFSYQANSTLFLDASGAESTLTFNTKQQPLAFLSGENSTQYRWTETNKIEAIIYADKSEEYFNYIGKLALLKRHIQKDGTQTTCDYSDDEIPLLISKTVREQQAKDNFISQYVYDKNFKGYYSGLRYEISPSGRVKEYILNGNGLVMTELTFLDDFYFSDGEEIHLKEMDNWKEKIKKNKPNSRVSLTHYQYDEQGTVSLIQKENSETKFVNDLYGRIIQKAVKYGNQQYVYTSSAYDDLGRIIKEKFGDQSSLAQETTHTYSDNKIITVLPNQRTETIVLNSGGLIKSESALVEVEGEKQQRQFQYQYDPKTRWMTVKCPDQNKLFECCDHEQQLTSSVSASGLVTEYINNKLYRYQIKTEYAQPISTSALSRSQRASLSKVKKLVIDSPKILLEKKILSIKDLEKDRTTCTFFGLNDKPQYEVDALDYLIEYQYDLLGNVKKRIEYSEKISEEEQQLLLSGRAIDRHADSAVDRISSVFYDADSYKIAEQDAAGYVTLFIRDAGGLVTQKINYSEPTLITDDEFSHIRTISNQEEDAYTYYFYDLNRQCTLEVDASGYITTHDYYPDGKKQKTTRYANGVNAEWYSDPSILPKIVPDITKDNEINYDYDVLRRQVQVRESNGSIKTYQYDEMNHEISSYHQDQDKLDNFSGDVCRGTAKRYDAWEQQIAYANPFIAKELMNAENNQILQKEIWQNYAEKFSHDQFGLKTKHQDTYGHTTLLYYDKEKRPVLSIDPTGAAIQYIRNNFGEIVQERRYYQRLADKILSSLSGGYIDKSIDNLLKKDDQDKVTLFTWDAKGQIISQEDPENNVSTFTYNAFKECSDEYLPAGTSTLLHVQHVREARGLEIKTIRSNQGQSITVENKYENHLGKQTEHVDEMGGSTRYQRDKLGNIKEIQKRLTPTQYVTVETTEYDFLSRPLIKTDAEGAAVKFLYDQKRRTVTANYLADDSEIISQHNIFGDIENVVKTASGNHAILHEESYEHAPHGEVAIHTDGLGKSHHVIFDLMGYKKEEWNANLIKSQYSHNAAYQMTESIVDAVENGLNLKTVYLPNAFGQDETIIDARQIVTNHTFDRRGKVLRSIQDAGKGGLNIITQQIHDQAGNETDCLVGNVSKPDQYHERVLMDGFNRVIATVIDPDNLGIWTNTAFNAAGNVIKKVDQLNYVQYAYYDSLQRKCFEARAIDDRQFVGIEYQYDLLNRLTSLRTYQLPVAKELLADDLSLSAAMSLFKTSAHDTVTTYFYNGKGKERFKIRLLYVEEKNQFEAYVEEKQYDAADREIKHIRYAKSFSDQEEVMWTTDRLTQAVVSLANPEQDHILYYWYDTASQERLRIDQDGAIIEKQYDNVGNVITEIRYDQSLETPIEAGEKLDTVLASIKKNPKDDRVTYYTYDNRNKLRFTVHPNGLVERRDYDENANPTQVCQFAERIETADHYLNLVKTLDLLVPNPLKDQITKTSYDRANRIETTTDALGCSDHFEHDALGQTTLHTDRAGKQWEKESDSAKRVITEKSPETLLTTTYRDESGQLQYKSAIAKPTKKIKFDQASNAIVFSIGDGLSDTRTMNAAYDANRNVVGTRVEDVTIDNSTDESYLAHPDLSILPEKKVVVETVTIYNTKNKKIAEKDENNHWSYYFYDSLERLIVEIKKEQAVIHYTYNAFDEIIEERHAAVPVNMDFGSYRQTGCLDASLLKALQTDINDRIVTKEYSRQGLESRILSGSTFYYTSGLSGFAQAETIKKHNTFGECIYEAALISPTIWAKKFFKHDQGGRLIAEINENKYLTYYQRDVFGNVFLRTDYAQPLMGQLHPLDNLSSIVEVIQTDKDKIYFYNYDLLNQKEKETLLLREHINTGSEPVAYRLEEQKEGFTLNAYEKCSSQHWTYTPTQQEASITYEDGTKSYKLYDECHFLAAEIKVSRTDIHGTGGVITPFTLYLLNTFGQKSVVREGVLSGNLISEPTLSALYKIKPISESLSLFDQRGLIKIQQDAEGHLKAFTYTLTKKVARELSVISIWHPGNVSALKKLSADKKPYVYINKQLGWLRQDTANQLVAFNNNEGFSLLQHIDERKLSYNQFDLCTALSFVREGVIEETILTQYNTFGEMIAEGKDDTWPLRQKMNTRGNAFYTNASGGISTIYLHDLRGQETLMLQAPNDDLSSVEIADLPTLLTWDSKRLERTETIRDLAGRMIGKKMPVTFQAGGADFSRTYYIDRWDNIRQESDASANIVIEREFNHQDKLTQETFAEVEVVLENGQSIRQKPITLHHHNARGYHVGITDANQHTEMFILDEAGQWLTHILGDGTVAERRVLNASGQPLTIIDARGQSWKYEYNKLQQLMVSLFPSGKKLLKTYDGKGGLSSEIEPSGSTLRYNQDVRGNVWERYLPLGQLTRTVHDHQRLPILTVNPDLSQLISKRDYFGIEVEHVNLSGQVTVCEHDYKQQLTHQYMRDNPGRSIVEIDKNITYKNDPGKIFPLVIYKSHYANALPQNLTYNYSYGLLDQVYDASTKKTVQYHYDLEQRRNKKTITQAGQLRHEIGTTYDVLGRKAVIIHTRLSPMTTYDNLQATIKYDAASNQRVFSVMLDPSDYCADQRSPQQNLSSWYTFDDADRVKINGGQLVNGAVQLLPGQGAKFDYQQNKRTQEQMLKSNGTAVTTQLNYTEDDLLSATAASTGVQTVRYYQQQGWQIESYKEFYIPGNYYYMESELKRKLNGNGWCYRDEYYQVDRDKKNHHEFRRTTNNQLNNLGILEYHESWQSQDGYASMSHLYHNYLKLDSWIENQVSGKYETQDGGAGIIPPAKFFYDSNAIFNGKNNSGDEHFPYFGGMVIPKPNDSLIKVHFDADYEGHIFNKELCWDESDNVSYNGNFTYAYLYDVNGQVFGGYSFLEYSMAMIYMSLRPNADRLHATISPFAMRQLLNPVGKTENGNPQNSSLDWATPFTAWHDLQMYIVHTGDSLTSIASKMFGDEHGASAIARLNGLPSIDQALKSGHQLKIPPYIGMHNKAANIRPYDLFINVMAGSLIPNFRLPPRKEKNDKHILGMLIKMIAVAIVVIIAPYLAPLALTMIGVIDAGIVLTSIAAGVIAALGDAAIQGVAIATHIQSDFSFNEMLETGVAAALNTKLKGAGFVERMLVSATANVTTQLVEMEAGLRDKFDARAIGLQVGAQVNALGIGTGVAKLGLVETAAFIANETVNAASNALLTSTAYHMPFNVESMMMNGLASAITNKVGGYIEKAFTTPTVNTTSPAQTQNQGHPKSQPKQTYSNHEMAEAEAVARYKIDKPGLTISDKPLYSKAGHDLSEINRKQINNRVQNWNSQAGKSWGSKQENAQPVQVRTISTNHNLTLFERAGRIGNAAWQGIKTFPKAFYDDVTDHPFNPTYRLAKHLVGTVDTSLTYLQSDTQTRNEMAAGLLVPGMLYGGAAGLTIGLVSRTGMYGTMRGMESIARKAIIEENLTRSQMLHEKYGSFTKHSIDRVIERGIPPQNILESLKNPLDVGPIKYDQLGRPSQKITGQTTTFVINPETKSIITTYPTSSSIANKLLKQINENLESNRFKPK